MQLLKSKVSIRIAHEGDQEKIVSLRLKSYQEKYPLRLKKAGLAWNQKDRLAQHFVVEYLGEIVSTVRLFKITNPLEFEDILPISSRHEFASLPSYVLSRAATCPAFSKQSLNLLLRLEAMYFIRNNRQSEKYLFGTARPDAQRLNLLRQLGYELMASPNHWAGFLQTEKPPVIFRLDLVHKLESAIATLEEGIREL